MRIIKYKNAKEVHIWLTEINAWIVNQQMNSTYLLNIDF